MLAVILYEFSVRLGTMVLGLFILWVVWWTFSSKVRKMEKIPGPAIVPFVGNALQVNKPTHVILKITHEEWTKKYGEIYRVWLGIRNYIVISAPQYIEIILSSQKIISKGVSYQYLDKWIGEGLLTSTGPKWRSRRRLFTPAFHFQILDTFFKVYNEQSKILVDMLNKADIMSQKPIDIYPYLTHCALDVICEATMGICVSAQEKDSEYVKAIYRVSQLVMERVVRPWLGIDWIYNLTSSGREFNHCLDIIHSFTKEVIENRRKEIATVPLEDSIKDSDTKVRYAFLDTLLRASQVDETITMQDIREEVDTFMFEGHDTTSAAMSWFLYCMAKYPQEQARVYEEIESVFGKSDRACTTEDISQLKYLECCIKEALRMFPSVPVIERQLYEDIKMGGYDIPAGCTVFIAIYALHHNKAIFHDPYTYKPERFFNEESHKRHPYAFIPFSAGPRNCIGQKFALLEEKIVLSTLLRYYSFSIDPKMEELDPCLDLILKSKQGIPLLISRRKE